MVYSFAIARRAIAAQALNEKLLAGHTIIDSSDDSCPCEKCGNQFLLTKVNGSDGGDKVCVVCPAIETNLVKVINDINLSDPYYKVKRELEEEIRLLQESLDSKTKESVEAIQAEADAIKSKREAEEAQEMHSKNIKEAEVIADRVGILSKGKLILVEEKKDLIQKFGKKIVNINHLFNN